MVKRRCRVKKMHTVVFLAVLWLFTGLPPTCYVQAEMSPNSSVEVTPPIMVSELGDSVMFNCTAQGGPNNTFQWMRNGEVLDGETAEMLTLTNVTASDGGVYTCVVTNGAGNDSDSSTLYIRPYFITEPMDILTFVGFSNAFTCEADGFPTPNVTWFNVDTGQQVASGSELSFGFAITYGNAGRYQCVATSVLPDGTSLNATVEPPSTLYVSPQGSVSVGPSTINHALGDNVTLTCNALGGPDNTLQFLKDGVLLINETENVFLILTITNIDASDGGSYTCIVSNSAGSGTASTTLNVQPYFTTLPQTELLTNVNTTVNFTCEAEGFPTLSISWQQLYSNLTVIGEVSNVSELLFDPVQFGDEGNYQCVAISSGGTFTEVYQSHSVLIVSPNSSVEVTPPIMVSELGDSVMFNCTAQGGPDNTFQWTRNGEVLDGETAEMLTLINVTASDSGVYTCVVTNAAGDDSDSSTLYIRPYFITEPMDILSFNGDFNAIFTCEADGFPTPNVTWFNVGTGQQVASGSELSFGIAVSFNDAGRYQCVATSVLPDGTSLNATVEPPSTLYVSPQGSIISSTINHALGDNVTLTCRGQGGPDNTLQLLKDGVLLINGTGNVLSVTITNIDASDGGLYTCIVSNPAGSGTAITIHTVQPYFTTLPQTELLTNVNTTVNFTCEAEGFPTPSISWQKLYSNLTVIGEVSIVSELLFDPVQFGDEGNYQCMASSSGGTFTEVYQPHSVLIVSPNSSVKVIPPIMVSELGDSVMFNCTAQGGLNNTFQWTRNGEVLDGETAEMLTLTNVTASDSGVYTCVVTNGAGNDSDSSTLYIRPYFITEPMDILTFVGFSNAFTCEADGFPTPNVTWFNVGTGQQVASGSELSFGIAVSFNDAGRYQCVATSVLPDGTSLNATVEPPSTLYVSPQGSVSVGPSTINHALGNNVTLTCRGQGGPDNTLQWLKDGVLLINGTRNVLSVTITNIDASDGGLYTCNVSNSAGSGSASTTLNVRPYFTTLPQTELLTNVNVTVNFTCEAEGFPTPSISWQKLYSNLTVIGEVSNVSELLFDPVRFGDEGNYQCMAISSGGTFTEVYQPHSVLVVSPFGSVSVTPVIPVAMVNNTITFMCSAQGGPNNTFQWMNDGIVIVNETEESLIITVIVASDGGNYTCAVSNQAGNDSSTSILYVEPYIVTHPEPDVQVTNGTNVSLSCLAEAFPSPSYVWEKLNSTSGEFYVVFSERVFEFTAMFGDEGTYRCIASINVEMEFTTESDNTILTVTIHPELVESPIDLNVTLLEGEIIQSCNATGFPLPTIQWYHNGSLVVEDNRTDIVFMNNSRSVLSTLTVSVAMTNDSGDYLCDATNSAGSVVSDTVQVLVQERPDPPTDVITFDFGARWIALSWTPGDRPVAAFNIYIRNVNKTEIFDFLIQLDPGALSSNDGSFMYNISDQSVVFPFTQYSFRVDACNEIFCSEQSDPSVEIMTDQDRPDAAPVIIEAFSPSSTSVYLRWDPPPQELHRGILTGYRIAYYIENMEPTVQTTTDTSIMLESLRAFTSYTVNVSAGTAVGYGPSITIAIMTLDDTGSGSNGAIIGGTVAAVVILLILIVCIVVIIVILVLKSRKASYNLENDKNRFDDMNITEIKGSTPTNGCEMTQSPAYATTTLTQTESIGETRSTPDQVSETSVKVDETDTAGTN